LAETIQLKSYASDNKIQFAEQIAGIQFIFFEINTFFIDCWITFSYL